MPLRSTNKNKKKSNSSHCNNPLSRARKQQQSGNSAAEHVWFRKSGLGYLCFLEYYAHQPGGTVCSIGSSSSIATPTSATSVGCYSADAADLGNVTNASLSRREPTAAMTNRSMQRKHPTTTTVAAGCGMSRAAKKRRLKKAEKGADGTRGGSGCGCTEIKDDTDTSSCSSPPTVSLVETMAESSRRTKSMANEQAPYPLWQSYQQNTLFYQRQDTYNGELATTDMSTKRQHYVHLKSFVQAMSRPLPLTFRVRSTADPLAVSTLRNKLQAFNENSPDETMTTTTRIQPVSLSLQIDHDKTDLVLLDAYQTTGSKAEADPILKQLLLEYSQNGVLARQELGSMLPVMALTAAGCFLPSTNNHHYPAACLDLCASPGSKTLQLLEVLLSTAATTKTNHTRNCSGPQLLLVANDILPSRLEALQQAVTRSGMPKTSVITYTCQDASRFQVYRVATATATARTHNNISLRRSNQTTTTKAMTTKGSTSIPSSSTLSSSRLLLRFDVILCDVPCSGDGTCRKDRHVLPQWTPKVGQRLHDLQCAILFRALQLLQPGGTVCYSTCSLNPVENEAVVAAALERYCHHGQPQRLKVSSAGGKPRHSNHDNNDNNDVDTSILEVVECPTIPGLILRNGISNWKVADYDENRKEVDMDDEYSNLPSRKNAYDNGDDDDSGGSRLTWYATYEDTVAASAKRSGGGVGKPSSSSSSNNNKNNKTAWSPTMWPPSSPTVQQQLARCKRLWPQDQDTGGFFFALIRKRKPTAVEK